MLQRSVEYVEVSITAATEPVIVNLTLGQDETQCTPFYSMRPTEGVTDQNQDRLAAVEFIDNSGTPAVRVTAPEMVETGPIIFQIFVIEWDPSIVVQQVAVTGFNGISIDVAINDVGDQSTAFFTYSHHFTNFPSSDDDFNDAIIQYHWNGAATDSITLQRASGDATVDGFLYVVECNSDEFTVEHLAAISFGTNQTSNIGTVASTVLADTFLIHSYQSSEASDDVRDAAFQADLQNSTTVRIRRTVPTATPSAQSEHRIQVVECQNNEWDVQRNDILVLSAISVTETVTAVDRTRSFAQMLHSAGFTSLSRDNTTTGNQVNVLMCAIDLSADDTVRVRKRTTTSIDDIVSYEVVQFADADGGAASAVLPIVFDVAADLRARGQLQATLDVVYSVTADLRANGQISAAAAIVFNVAANLEARGQLDAALAVVFSLAADLGANGQLDVALETEFSVAADLRATGQLDTALGIVFDVLAGLTDANIAGPVSAVLPAELSVEAELRATGQLDTSLPIIFAVAADLRARGQLDASLSIIFNVVASLTDAGGGAINAALGIVFSAVADLRGAGEMQSANDIVFSVVADLRARGQLDASLDAVFSVAATLRGEGRLDATLAVVFDIAAQLQAEGRLDAALEIVFSVVADLQDSPGLQATLPIEFSIGASLTNLTPVVADKMADPTSAVKQILHARPRVRLYAKRWNMFAETFDAFLRRQESLVRETVHQVDNIEDVHQAVVESPHFVNDLAEVQNVIRERMQVSTAELVQALDDDVQDLILAARDEQDILEIVALIASDHRVLH